MSYITRSQYVARFGQEEISELLASGSAVSFSAAAEDASAIIDSYLESSPTKYDALPLDPVPPRIVEIAGELCRYKLWGAKASEQVAERYKAAIEYLEKIASGVFVGPGSQADQGLAAPAYIARPRVFTDENLIGF